MKSNKPKVQGLEKAKQYLESILDPDSVLILPTGERVNTTSESLKTDINKYMNKDLSKLDHTVAIDKKTEKIEVVLIPIVEAG